MNDSLFWDTHTAILENIRLQYFAWDQTDGMACGFQYINKTSKMPPSFSLETKFAIQLRYGCDGTAGTVGVIDHCGICGGDNSSCTGCDGVVNSGAVYGTWTISFFYNFQIIKRFQLFLITDFFSH